MKLAMENRIKSIAFSSISTGIYHFPVEQAAKIAVNTVKCFIDDNEGTFDFGGIDSYIGPTCARLRRLYREIVGE